MNVLTHDTAIKLMCCADAFDAMIANGEMPTADQIRLAIDAMREAIPALQVSDPIDEGADDVYRGDSD